GVAPVALVLAPAAPSLREASAEVAFALLTGAGSTSLLTTASAAALADDAGPAPSAAASAAFSFVATASLGGNTRSSSVGSIFSHFFRKSSGTDSRQIANTSLIFRCGLPRRFLSSPP